MEGFSGLLGFSGFGHFSGTAFRARGFKGLGFTGPLRCTQPARTYFFGRAPIHSTIGLTT